MRCRASTIRALCESKSFKSACCGQSSKSRASCFLLRGVLWLFGPKGRKGNFVYDILTVGAMPFMTVTRAFTRRVMPDAYVRTLTFFLLMGMWVMLGLAQHAMCVSRGVQCV